jgi:hypothetical protein
MVDATEVGVQESTERLSEITLDDGTVIRVKPNVISAARLDGKWDPEGNPQYAIRSAPMITIVKAPPHLRKPIDQKVH